jgi:hypothetical protein
MDVSESSFVQYVPQLLLVQFLDHGRMLQLDLGWESEDRSTLVYAGCSQLRRFWCSVRIIICSNASGFDARRLGAIAGFCSSGFYNSRHRCSAPVTEDPATGSSRDGFLCSSRETLVGCHTSQEAVAVALCLGNGGPCSVSLCAADDGPRADTTLSEKSMLWPGLVGVYIHARY